MYGNLINNRQLVKLMETNVIEIDPFSNDDLGLVHYTLHINKIKKIDEFGKLETKHNFSENENAFFLDENEYVIIEILEQIKLNDENIVGRFIPSSNLIEQGLGLTAGKIDKKFGNSVAEKGTRSEMIHFGVKNQLSRKNEIKKHLRIAHLELVDLRGVASNQVNLSREELKIRLMRAVDDGVFYWENEK